MSEHLHFFAETENTTSRLIGLLLLCILLTLSGDINYQTDSIPAQAKRDCNTITFSGNIETNLQTVFAQAVSPNVILAEQEPASPNQVFELFQVSPEILNFRFITLGWYFPKDYGANITVLNHTENINAHLGDIEVLRALLVRTKPDQYQIILAILYPHGEPHLINLDTQCFPDQIYASLNKHGLYPTAEVCNNTVLWLLYREQCDEGTIIYPNLTADFNVGGPGSEHDPFLTVERLKKEIPNTSAVTRYFGSTEVLNPWIDQAQPGNVFAPYGSNWKVSLPSLVALESFSDLERASQAHPQ